MRDGQLAEAAKVATDAWWETGHLFHKAQQFHKPLPDRDLQIAGWIHLGWMWDRALGKQSLYEAGPLSRLKLNRHVTWVILRTMVERRSGSLPMCADVESLAQWGADHWMHNALTLAYRELQYRAQKNMLPQNRTFCANKVQEAQAWLGRRVGSSAQAALQPLADETLALIRTGGGPAANPRQAPKKGKQTRAHRGSELH